MKIIMQAPTDYAEDDPVIGRVLDLIHKAAGRVKDRDTELVFRSTIGPSDLDDLAWTGSRFIGEELVLCSILKAAQEPVDGIISHCFFDSALWPARQLLDIPITGLAESAMGLAKIMGRRFAILTVSAGYVPAMEDMITLYGHRTSAIDNRPVRAIPATESDAIGWLLEDRLDRLVDAVRPIARACIADGADVLIVGCGLTSVLLAEGAGIQAIDGVPFVTPTVAAVKMAETLVGLNRSGLGFKSGTGYWGPRPAPHASGDRT